MLFCQGARDSDGMLLDAMRAAEIYIRWKAHRWESWGVCSLPSQQMSGLCSFRPEVSTPSMAMEVVMKEVSTCKSKMQLPATPSSLSFLTGAFLMFFMLLILFLSTPRENISGHQMLSNNSIDSIRLSWIASTCRDRNFICESSWIRLAWFIFPISLIYVLSTYFSPFHSSSTFST